ncbi:MAG: 3'-5' exonuclease [Deltaproteobacteria bacterium]|nr:3'-5' exonuclease [Deltaproteobacteria bacterium]
MDGGAPVWHHPRVDYFCVDVESSGPIPGIHNLLSVGMTHVRRFEGRYQPFEDVYVELQPVFPGFEDAAMAVNKLDAARLESEGMAPERAMQTLVDFVNAHHRTSKKDRPVFVAHNAPFDWMFFVYYCGHFDVENPFGHSALDTKALAMGKLGMSWNETSLRNVRTKVGVESIDLDKLHHAGEDARYLARVFSAMMNG